MINTRKARLSDKEISIIKLLFECNRSVSSVAKKICYSRSSVYNFIKKINDKTGFNPLEIKDLIQLQKIYGNLGD
ncbi:MAG: hypothetical protein IJT36_01770 [Alphaproteobacteria bacterium]|nr:hypothetical protein [Alphaproteobacteria bacterium]